MQSKKENQTFNNTKIVYSTGCARKIDTIKFDYFTIEGAFSTNFYFMELKLIIRQLIYSITFCITFLRFDKIHFEFVYF